MFTFSTSLHYLTSRLNTVSIQKAWLICSCNLFILFSKSWTGFLYKVVSVFFWHWRCINFDVFSVLKFYNCQKVESGEFFKLNIWIVERKYEWAVSSNRHSSEKASWLAHQSTNLQSRMAWEYQSCNSFSHMKIFLRYIVFLALFYSSGCSLFDNELVKSWICKPTLHISFHTILLVKTNDLFIIS